MHTIRLRTHHFPIKMPYQQLMLRQIEWWVQNGPITRNGVFYVTTLFVFKFCFGLPTFYKELTWCTNDPNVYIRIFCKRWTFIWRRFFPVDILKHSCCGKNYVSRKNLSFKFCFTNFLKVSNSKDLDPWLGESRMYIKPRSSENVEKVSIYLQTLF